MLERYGRTDILYIAQKCVSAINKGTAIKLKHPNSDTYRYLATIDEIEFLFVYMKPRKQIKTFLPLSAIDDPVFGD